MITLGLDFVVIKDHRGCQSGFFWGDVQQIISVYTQITGNQPTEKVEVRFRDDPKETYTLVFEMAINEFLAEVKEQLNHPPRFYSDVDVMPTSFDDIEDGTTKEE